MFSSLLNCCKFCRIYSGSHLFELFVTSRAREKADRMGSSRGSPGLGESDAEERRTDHLIPQTSVCTTLSMLSITKDYSSRIWMQKD